MLKVYLMLFLLAAAVFAESVRETETWMPLKDGESYDGSGDFAFLDEEHTTIDDEDMDDYDDDDDDDSYRDMSGSGDDEENFMDVISKPGLLDNHIPDAELPVQPQEEEDLNPVEQNEVAFPPSVHLSHAGEHNIFKKTEVLAAVIAGGVVGLLFAVLLILLLVYCLKKKDEGSYDLGKKPIYKKAPTTEIYA